MDPKVLLSDDAFARRLAYGLLRDRDGAEDLVQEAWVSLLRRPPRDDRGLRGYWKVLLTRLAGRRRREAGRRERRERTRARGELMPSSAELVERAEIHRRTVAAVLALPEPYRTTVLLRFFEDLSNEEIARCQGLPLETVRTHLRRGLVRLRAELEQEGQDWREDWAVALAGLGKATRSTSLARWGLAGAALVGVGLWRWSDAGGPREPDRAVAGLAEVDAPPRVASGGAFAPSGERAALSATPASSTMSRTVWQARVVDREGRPLAGAGVWVGVQHYTGAEELARVVTDDEGTFRTSLEAWHALPPYGRELLALQLTASKAGHAQLSQELTLGNDLLPLETEFVLAPGRLVSVRMLAPEGGPAAFVQGTFTVRNADGRKERRASSISDSDGWIHDTLAAGERVVGFLAFQAQYGFAWRAEHELPANDAGDVTLGEMRMERGGTLRGRLTYPDGSPARLCLVTRPVELAPDGDLRVLAAGADVDDAGGMLHLGDCTDAEGRFEMRGLRGGLYQLVSGPNTLAGGAAFAPDGPEIDVRVEHTQLVVEVAGEDGRLLEEARVAVTRLGDAGEPSSIPLRRLTGRDPLCAILQLPPGRYAVLAWAPAALAPERVVTLPDLPGETTVRLTLAPERRDATLSVRPRTGAADGWRVDLLAPLSLVPLSGLQDLVPDAEGRIGDLPRGACALRVERRVPLAPDEGPVTCYGAPLSVELVAGENALDLAPEPAARLRVRFGEDPPAPELEPLHAEDLNGIGAGPARFAWLDGTIVGPFWRLEVRPAGGGAPLERLPSLRPRAGTVVDVLVPARPLALVLTLDGRPHLERELAPAPGATLEIRVPLPAPAAR